MEICSNLKTGQTFIHLDSQDNGNALMVTPNGIVLELEYDFFSEPVDIDDGEALTKGRINQSQFNVYSQYGEH